MRDIRGGRIAYIPQEPMSNLDPSFTIGSQLTEPMRIKLGVSKTEVNRLPALECGDQCLRWAVACLSPTWMSRQNAVVA